MAAGGLTNKELQRHLSGLGIKVSISAIMRWVHEGMPHRIGPHPTTHGTCRVYSGSAIAWIRNKRATPRRYVAIPRESYYLILDLFNAYGVYPFNREDVVKLRPDMKLKSAQRMFERAKRSVRGKGVFEHIEVGVYRLSPDTYEKVTALFLPIEHEEESNQSVLALCEAAGLL